jgi:hypothetical protein
MKGKVFLKVFLAIVVAGLLAAFPAVAQPDNIGGKVEGGGGPITDVAIDPAGNLWVANNWDRPDEGFKKVPEPALSTRFGGNGTVVFFGVGKPVRTPLIGPSSAP